MGLNSTKEVVDYFHFGVISSSIVLKNNKMEAIVAVEKEIDKIVSKFGSIREHGTKNIDETLEFLSSIKPELEQGK